MYGFRDMLEHSVGRQPIGDCPFTYCSDFNASCIIGLVAGITFGLAVLLTVQTASPELTPIITHRVGAAITAGFAPAGTFLRIGKLSS